MATFRDWLRRLFWREDDPLWRWFCGQWRTRRALARPAPLAALASLIPFPALATLTLMSGARVSHAFAVAGMWIDAGVFLLAPALSLWAILFPFLIFGGLGGAAMLRDLRLSRLGRDEAGRLFVWGTIRWAALPAAVFLLSLCAQSLAARAMLGHWPRPYNRFLYGIFHAQSGLYLFGLWLRPPLEMALNIVIAWRFLALAGPSARAVAAAAAVCIGLSIPGDPFVGYLAGLASRALARSDAFRGISIFIWIAFLALKCEYARRCYFAVLRDWDRAAAND